MEEGSDQCKESAEEDEKDEHFPLPDNLVDKAVESHAHRNRSHLQGKQITSFINSHFRAIYFHMQNVLIIDLSSKC